MQITEPLPTVPPSITVVALPPERIEQTIYVPSTPQPEEARAEVPPKVAMPELPIKPQAEGGSQPPSVEVPSIASEPQSEIKASSEEEKISAKPPHMEGGTSTGKLKIYNGKGRRHTDDQIDEILDEYLMSGDLPQYVSDRQRRDYRKHKRLPLRRIYLEQAGIQTILGSKEDSGDVLRMAERKAQRETGTA